jgi:hypothetical protein
MAGSLTEYALRLSEDPEELATFKASTEAAIAAMTAAGLSAEDRDALLSGDWKRIGAALAADARVRSFGGRSGEAMEGPGEAMEGGPDEAMEGPGEAMEGGPEPMEGPGEAMEGGPEPMEGPGEAMEGKPGEHRPPTP